MAHLWMREPVSSALVTEHPGIEQRRDRGCETVAAGALEDGGGLAIPEHRRERQRFATRRIETVEIEADLLIEVCGRDEWLVGGQDHLTVAHDDRAGSEVARQHRPKEERV